MENTFIIWLHRFQAQGSSALASFSGQVLRQNSYYDRGYRSLTRKRNGEQMSRKIWKEIPSDPSGSKEVPCQLRMKRVTYSVISTTLNTATLFPKIWLGGNSANRAMKSVLFRGVRNHVLWKIVNPKCRKIKIRVTFLSLPIPAAVRCKT
jgi:hypothetical protein